MRNDLGVVRFRLATLVGIVDINAVGSDGRAAETMNNEPLQEK
ncbi:hypothetical protein [Elioraea sp. Yellowstone]|jgi:transketolase N-terminal domain/subunit|nr:hypothetical protein [Elioraea sp. Yellowstone]